MIVLKTELEGVLIIEPRVFLDSRGYFFESFSQRDFDAQVAPVLGHPITFVQDNESKSVYGVVRGLHYQNPPYTQCKLVRCVRGRVLDVAVDIRKGSPTFGRHVAVELTEDNHRQLLIDEAVFQYKCDEFYHPEADSGIQLLDPSLGIDWHIPEEAFIMSEKDRARAVLADTPLVFKY